MKWKGRIDCSVRLDMSFLFSGCLWVLDVKKPTLKPLEQPHGKRRGPQELLASWNFLICPGLPATVLVPKKKKYICLVKQLLLGLVLWSQIKLLANEMVITCFLYARFYYLASSSVWIWHALFWLVLTAALSDALFHFTQSFQREVIVFLKTYCNYNRIHLLG